eukprot:NODE_75_length_23955_cov_0.435069.p18 type:complete len:152 gc:universal NODE_75_length_23955_cov_0.435069:5957-5502(-)
MLMTSMIYAATWTLDINKQLNPQTYAHCQRTVKEMQKIHNEQLFPMSMNPAQRFASQGVTAKYNHYLEFLGETCSAPRISIGQFDGIVKELKKEIAKAKTAKGPIPRNPNGQFGKQSGRFPPGPFQPGRFPQQQTNGPVRGKRPSPKVKRQ